MCGKRICNSAASIDTYPGHTTPGSSEAALPSTHVQQANSERSVSPRQFSSPTGFVTYCRNLWGTPVLPNGPRYLSPFSNGQCNKEKSPGNSFWHAVNIRMGEKEIICDLQSVRQSIKLPSISEIPALSVLSSGRYLFTSAGIIPQHTPHIDSNGTLYTTAVVNNDFKLYPLLPNGVVIMLAIHVTDRGKRAISFPRRDNADG
ncbi:hypothetical protein NQ317_019821 [Molorchus minor]|uniref:Uncharacterized protein n=1 Tax=Molorchus minor TaxID=1323400 RepID=A0ABQ9J0B9_9CUCU|nr:hypothetical protein NQ317_019821 [Molorchus minor]